MVTMIRSDLDFILAQIQIAEADARHEANPVNNPPILGTLIPNSELPWGLRRVDGSNNNLLEGQGTFGSADQPFPATAGGTPLDARDDVMRFGPPNMGPTGPIDYGFLTDPTQPAGPDNLPLPLGYIPTYATFLDLGVTAVAGGVTTPSGVFIATADFRANLLTNNDYGVNDPNNPLITNPRALQSGDVVDADPRIISNLVVDQTLNNPAAVFKALQMAGAEDDPGTPSHDVLDAMQEIMAAVGGLKTARGDLATAIEALAGNASQVQAYLAATAASDSLAALAALVDTTTSALVSAPGVATHAAAVTAVVGLVTQLNAVRDALGTNGVAADVAAIEALIGTSSAIQATLGLINPADGFDGTEVALAAIVEAVGNGVVASTTAAHTQLLGTLDGLDVAVEEAQTALLAAEAALEVLIEENGLATDNTPGNTDILKTTLLIENVAPDVGLSAPFNGWMTLFGQFFDHGLDLVAKGGFGTVYIPLQPDDPLYVEGSNTNFMAVTRATLSPVLNSDGTPKLDAQGNPVLAPTNKTTPFVDQNQTYTSNASHQVFLREYELRDDGTGNLRPFATGKLLDGSAASGGGLPTWADIKAQALNVLGIELNDFNIHSVPEILVDPYGNFIPGANGFPQLVTAFGPPIIASEGNLATPVRTADGQVSTGHAFLDDIAHNANPDAGEVADSGVTESGVDNISVATHGQAAGTYDNELLDRHFITGDGRGNENIGLTAVHHVFHSEHNRQIEVIKATVLAENDLAFLNEWLAVPVTSLPSNGDGLVWNGERLFQAAKFPTEMQYQHLVFEEFARTVQPMVNVFNDYDASLDAAIVGEFAHTVYRFGHSMLNETVDRYSPLWETLGTGANPGDPQIGLIEAFLNPVEFSANGLTAFEAAGAIARGMTRQVGNEIDEFVTEALRNNLVGLPLDLAAINIARGRELNVPTLNEARAEFFRGSGDAQVRPYTSWYDFMLNLKNPASVVNFIAAYGTHATITSAVTLAEKRDAALALVMGGDGAPDDRFDFLNARGDYAGGTLGGLNTVDFWIGGLAERQLPFGGMLGTTFNFVFEVQLETLQNADRFYYLSRLANLNLTAQLENNKFAEMIARNSDAKHLPGNVFKAADYYLEVDQTQQYNVGLGTEDPTGIANGQDPFVSGANGDAKVWRVDPTGRFDGQYDGRFIGYFGGEHVVFGGTDGDDFFDLERSEGDNTVWGDEGNDRVHGGYGNEMIFGGDGDDIITDPFGINEIRSQAGDDVVAVGGGVNLIITDTGNDVVFGGNDMDEMLLGQGDDFAHGGAGEDFIIGGEGSDWIESGTENALLLGDNGDLIQGLPIKVGVANPVGGNDVMIGGAGNNDFDAEAGDDIMVAGSGTERFFGAQGFDWASHGNDPRGVAADMNVRLFQAPAGPTSPNAFLDRYSTTEGLSGSAHGDILRGDDSFLRGEPGVAPEPDVADPGLHALRNIDLIDGLRAWLPIAVTDAGVFDGGNIILGGGGSDVIEGRGGDDLIDGDRALNVRIEVTADAARGQNFPTFSIQSISEITDRMLSGEIKVAQLRVVREIIDGSEEGDVDTAEFSGLRAHYEIEGNGTDTNGDGFISVRHRALDAQGNEIVGQNGADGHDQLKNIERLRFNDETIEIGGNSGNSLAAGRPILRDANGAEISTPPTAGLVIHADLSQITDADNATAGNRIVDAGGAALRPFTITWQAETVPGSGVYSDLMIDRNDNLVPLTGPSLTVTTAMEGLSIRAHVQFVDSAGVIEVVTSLPAGGGAAVQQRPLFNEVDAVLGLDQGGILPDGTTLPAGSFGILEDSGPFTFTIGNLLFDRNGVALASDPNGDAITILPNSLSVRVVDGDPSPGTLVEVDTAQPWLNADGSPNLNKAFTFTPALNFTGGVIFEIDITDGITESIPAEIGLEVFPINDAPVPTPLPLGVINAGQPQTLTFSAALLFGTMATDEDGRPIDIDGDRIEIVAGSVTSPNGTVTDNLDGTYTFVPNAGFFGEATVNFSLTDDIVTVPGSTSLSVGRTLNGTAAGNTLSGSDAGDIVNGAGGNDTISGNGGDDRLTGGTGNDLINGGDGNDTVIWGVTNPITLGPITLVPAVSDGRDIVNGGLGGTDTFVVNGNNQAETYKIFARAAALAAGITGLSANTDIVVTRQIGTNNLTNPTNASVIAELDEIEEIVINTGPGNDTVLGIGDFSPTNLSFNTIRVSNSAGTVNVDVSGMLSAHRFVVTSADGATATITGKRSQDVLDNDRNGVDDDFGPIRDLDFALTASDLAGLKHLVTATPNDEEEAPVGVRDLSGLTQGVENDQFIRLTDARLGPDGAVNPLFEGLDPRNVSNILGTHEASLAKNAAGMNIFFMAFGQYFDHGLDFITKGGSGRITIDGEDQFGPNGPTNFVDLTRATQFRDADGNIYYQNQTAPLIDQNQAYGSHILVGQFLRESDGSGGFGSKLLKGQPDGTTGFHLLPTLNELIKHHVAADTMFANGKTLVEEYAGLMNSDGTVNAAVAAVLATNFMGSGHNLLLDANRNVSVLDHYIAGDGRVNENITLTSMHTVWARNHNWHVDNLVKAGFEGSPEVLFQAAKMINEAEYQRVVFTEYADALLGGMQGDGDHGFKDPNPDADARISHEFAVAAFRFGHSLISDTLNITGAGGPVKLTDVFLQPSAYAQFGAGNILSGIAGQQAEEVDFNLVDAVRNDLVGTKADLFAFNVARGWDVGLGTLNQVRMGLAASSDAYVREAVGFAGGDLSPYMSWEDFQLRNGLSDAVIAQFKQAYPDLVLTADKIVAFKAANPDIELVNGDTVKGIDRVEFWVGGLAERHINGGQVGQTFWVVLHEQLDRLQEADRFYYRERFDNFDFYVGEFENRTFADIVARTTGLTTLQPDLFRVVSADENENEDDDTASGDNIDDDHHDVDNDNDVDNDDDVDNDNDDDDDQDTVAPGSGSGGGSANPSLPGVVFAGTAANDAIFGSAGDDDLAGGGGDDTILGKAGGDNIVGGDGNDEIFAGAGNDIVSGGDGNDIVFGDDGADVILGGAGKDTLDGGSGADKIWGGAGRDVIRGDAGDDVIFAMAGDGNDVIDGGDGVDTIDYSAATSSLVIDLDKGLVTGGSTGEDVVTNVEKVVGSGFDDTIYANNVANVLNGGAGEDTFVFRTSGAADGDTIEGFQAGDTIALRDAFSGALSTPTIGQLTEGGQIKIIHEADGDSRIEGNTDADADLEFTLLVKNYKIAAGDLA